MSYRRSKHASVDSNEGNSRERSAAKRQSYLSKLTDTKQAV